MQRQGRQLLLITPVGGELPTAAIQNEAIGVTILNGVKHTLSYECASQEVSLEGMKGL